MKKNNLENITEKAIREDPYCYTLTEMAAVMGKTRQRRFFILSTMKSQKQSIRQ